MQINIEQATEQVEFCIKAGLSVMVQSSPGLGKSDMARQIAKKYNLFPVDVRLSQCDLIDVSGVPHFEGKKVHMTPLSYWPIEGDPIPDGYSGFLLLLDEFNSVNQAMQSAAYRVVLDREVGQAKLHPKTAIICLGNMSTDNAIVNRVSTAMQSRLVHLEIVIDAKIWLEKWAVQNNIDHRILAFINRYPDNLYNFDPDHNDKTFACPRTWYFTSKLIKKVTDLNSHLPVITGTISEGMGRDFVMFCQIYKDLPTMKEIVANPNSTVISDEPGMLYATSHFISSHTTEKILDKIMIYIDRMPIEFTTITLQNMIRRTPAWIDQPCIRQWMRVKGAELFN